MDRGSLKVPLRIRDAEGPEEILRQHGRVLEQPGPLPEDGGPGRVKFVPGRVRTGEPGHAGASVVPPHGVGRVTGLSPVPRRTKLLAGHLARIGRFWSQWASGNYTSCWKLAGKRGDGG